jgi:hypothetical protein
MEITEEELREVFANSNFGSSTNREVVNRSVVKTSKGFHIGNTAQCILIQLKLAKRIGLGINSYLRLTNEGKYYLSEIKRS